MILKGGSKTESESIRLKVLRVQCLGISMGIQGNRVKVQDMNFESGCSVEQSML